MAVTDRPDRTRDRPDRLFHHLLRSSQLPLYAGTGRGRMPRRYRHRGQRSVGYHALNNLFITLVSNTEVSSVQSPSLFVVSVEGHELSPGILMEVVIYGLTVLIFNIKYGWFRWRA